eukprot:Skav230126  [mRNA]  locus=scaffold2192:286142:292499:+ [translate_table: standard]
MFADSLRPDWETHIELVILPRVQHHAKGIWKNCTVVLRGSVARQVHNESSDIDIAIDTGSSPSIIDCEKEFRIFCNLLKQDRTWSFVGPTTEELSIDWKAAKFRFREIKVDVVILQRLEDSFFASALKKIESVYKECLGVRRAARVAKYAFSALRGVEVEVIVNMLHEERQQADVQDDSGLEMFFEVCCNILSFASSVACMNLFRHARSEHGQEPSVDLRKRYEECYAAAEPVLSQLSRVVSAKGTGALEQLHVSHPDIAEQRRDLLRRLGAEAEKDESRKAEAIREALDALKDDHSLVRLAGIHALARVAEIGSPYWQQVADMASDQDELVRVGALRAVGRMAQPGDAEALEFLEKAEREATDRSVAWIRHREMAIMGQMPQTG